jgi:uncharacterized membrane protein HdeD (DUF308 family)
MTTTNHTSALPGAFGEVHAKWGWFVALGILFIVLAAVAAGNLFLTTIATVYYVGASMIVAGVVQIVQSFRVKTWAGFLLWMLSGGLYALAGVMTFMNPLLASFVFTLMFALLALASGAARLWLGFQGKTEHGWGWIIASGVVTMVAGLIFLLGWPIDSLWLLGLLLSIDLAFQGCALIGLGLRFRAI